MGAKRLSRKIGDELWDNYFKFSTIRNPFEKIISMYFFKKYRKKDDYSDPVKTRKDFNLWCVESGPPLDRGIYTIDGKYILDDVVRAEVLNDEMERVCNKLNIPWNPSLIGRAKSDIRPEWATASYMYGQEAREAVEQVYDFELDFFNYAFPG
jgi:hypothetical protein